MDSTSISYVVAGLGAAWLAPKVWARLCLSLAKHRSLAGHPRIARRLARRMPFYEFSDAEIFTSDDAPAEIAARRYTGFMRLAEALRARSHNTLALTDQVRDGVSDMQFTAAYRVPFQYSRFVRQHLKMGAFVESSHGVRVRDLDGNEFYDLSGSYGVNVFGYDFYKDCMQRGSARAATLGPVLGVYHPDVAYNVERLREISGQDEVSFHMSGTEAVMQAVRLARYHTGRTHLVRFCGAYHGFWDDVQPGVGNPTTQRNTYTLADMQARTLRVLGTRNDIACVLVNPLQAMHPNLNAPSDSMLVTGERTARVDREAYSAWLRELREVCSARGIVLIFDEVFVGFRLALGGAQAYFGVRADMVTYGKTLGGGFPVGAICGRKDLMKRFRDDHPTDICFARGTFNSHPYVMAAMREFLERLDKPELRALYAELDRTWAARLEQLNARLAQADVPVRVAGLSSIWTVCFVAPSRYHWMLQYYLRAESLALSWVGTGRLIFSLNYSDADFEAVCRRFVAAARAMENDGFFWRPPGLTARAIKRRILRELLAHVLSPARRKHGVQTARADVALRH